MNKYLKYSLIILASIFSLWLVISIVIMALTPGSLFDNKVSWAPVPNYGYEVEFLELANSQKISFWTYEQSVDIATNPFNTEDRQNTDQPAILYLHGNTGRINDMILELSEFGTVYSPAYPGYGESEGSPSSELVYETALVAYDYMVNDLNIPEDNIILFGHSMGGSPAVYLAKERPNAKRLVLVNTFSSVQSMCFRQYAIFCGLTSTTLNTAKNAPDVTMPVRQFAYRADTSVPFEEGKTLYTYFTGTSDKEFIELEEYTHTYPDFEVVGEALRIN